MFPTVEEVRLGWADAHRLELFQAKVLGVLHADLYSHVQGIKLTTQGGELSPQECAPLIEELRALGWLVAIAGKFFYLSASPNYTQEEFEVRVQKHPLG